MHGLRQVNNEKVRENEESNTGIIFDQLVALRIFGVAFWPEREIKRDMAENNLTSKFVKVRCESCKNEQVVFGKSATTVKCLVCSKVLAEPSGGKTKIKAKILEVLG